MIKALYSNSQFLESVRDPCTTHLAYKFVENQRNVKIISTKATDSLISKIVYYVTMFFGGYCQADLSLQRNFCRPNFNVLDLLDPNLEGKTIRFRIENAALLKEKNELTQELERLNPNLQDLKRKIEESEEGENTSYEQTLQHKRECTRLESMRDRLTQDVAQLQAEKAGLEETIQLEGRNLSAFSEEHWEQVRQFLTGDNPVKYLSFLENRMSKLQEILKEDFPNSFESHPKSYENSSEHSLLQKDYVNRVSEVMEKLKAGVKSPEQKSSLLTKIGGIIVHPEIISYRILKRESVVENLKEYVDLSFRFHSVNHTNH